MLNIIKFITCIYASVFPKMMKPEQKQYCNIVFTASDNTISNSDSFDEISNAMQNMLNDLSCTDRALKRALVKKYTISVANETESLTYYHYKFILQRFDNKVYKINVFSCWNAYIDFDNFVGLYKQSENKYKYEHEREIFFTAQWTEPESNATQMSKEELHSFKKDICTSRLDFDELFEQKIVYKINDNGLSRYKCARAKYVENIDTTNLEDSFTSDDFKTFFSNIRYLGYLPKKSKKLAKSYYLKTCKLYTPEGNEEGIVQDDLSRLCKPIGFIGTWKHSIEYFVKKPWQSWKINIITGVAILKRYTYYHLTLKVVQEILETRKSKILNKKLSGNSQLLKEQLIEDFPKCQVYSLYDKEIVVQLPFFNFEYIIACNQKNYTCSFKRNGQNHNHNQKSWYVQIVFDYKDVVFHLEYLLAYYGNKTYRENQNCRFGFECTDKHHCLYKHPNFKKNCNFGLQCKKEGCQFVHNNPQGLICSQDLNCKKNICRYKHTKVYRECIFRHECKNPTCKYSH